MNAAPLVPLESAYPHVLVMDECVEILALFRDALCAEPIRLTLHRDLTSLTGIKQLRPDLIIMERRFQGSVVWSWMRIREIRRDPELADTTIVLCTTDATPRLSLTLQWELRSQDIHVLQKPFLLEDLLGLVHGARARALRKGQESLARLPALPDQELRGELIHLEEIHHDPANAFPDFGNPLPGWAPRRS